MVRGFHWQAGETHAEFILQKVYFFSRSEETGRLHLCLQTSYRNIVTRPKMHVHVESVALARKTSVIRAARLAKVGTIDGLAVAAHPLPHFAEHAYRLFGCDTVAPRAYIQEVIAAVAGTRDQVLNDAARTLPIVICPLVAPAIIESHARLPSSPFLLGGYLLLRGREVSWEFIAVVDDDLGLKLENHFIHARGFPPGGVQRPRHVIPKHVNLPVVGEQLTDVRVDVFDKTFAQIGRAHV